MMTDRVDHPPLGLFGGLAGTPNVLTRTSGEPIEPKSRTDIHPGEIVTMQTPGGGGYGLAADRDPAMIAHDLEFGYITPEAARRDLRSRADT